jgi:hypothetical protein
LRFARLGASRSPVSVTPPLILRTGLIGLTCGGPRVPGDLGMPDALRGIALGVTVGGRQVCLGCIHEERLPSC